MEKELTCWERESLGRPGEAPEEAHTRAGSCSLRTYSLRCALGTANPTPKCVEGGSNEPSAHAMPCTRQCQDPSFLHSDSRLSGPGQGH